MMSGNRLGTTSNAHPGFSALNNKMASLNIQEPALTAEGSLCALNSEMAGLKIRVPARNVERSPIVAQEDVTRAKEAISARSKKARRAKKKQKRLGKQNEKALNLVAWKYPLGPPALVYLAGPRFTEYDSTTLMDKILIAIEERTAKTPNMILRGRTAEMFRIDYDPKSDHVTGIKSRATELMSLDFDYTGLEALLSPLVTANLKTLGYKSKQISTIHRFEDYLYHDSWCWGFARIDQVKPVTWDKRRSVVIGIWTIVRQRCMSVNPFSKLFFDPNQLENLMNDDDMQHCREWSLHGEDTGLARKLMECFSNPERSTAEYEDLIERTLYCYKIANKSAMFAR